MLCWVSKKALEPGTWSGPLGKARAVDLGCIPILTPMWYWKEYGVTRPLPGTWMTEHLACVPVLRPGKYTCENRVRTPVSIPTINPLMRLPKAYWFSIMEDICMQIRILLKNGTYSCCPRVSRQL